MILSCLPNISWNLSNNGSFSLLHCASAKLLAVDAALLESGVSWCPAHVLNPCLKHPTFSRGAFVPVYRTHMSAHTQTHPWEVGIRYDGTGAALKSTKVPKNQHSTNVQLTPNTFKKPSPQPLPACSTQTSSQCLLLYLSLKLQYYWEASGSLILLSASQVHSGKVFTAQAPPFGTVKMSNLSPLLSHLQHYHEALSSILNWQLYILTVSNHLLTRFLLP